MKRLRFLILIFFCQIFYSIHAIASVSVFAGSKINPDLPIVITKAKIERGDKLVLIISGDGGWTSFSQQLANSYAANGIPVIGLNSLKYFWEKKTPQEAASDIAVVLNKYAGEWKKRSIIICGFSFGAEVTPFIYRRLPNDLREKISLVQLVSPASFTDFEIHIADLIGTKNPIRSMNIASEVKMMHVPVLCYYGDLEKEKPLAGIKKTGFRIIILQGDHHYKNSYPEIVKTALE